MQRSSANSQARNLAIGLGWFSLALGITELLRPRAVKQQTGAPAPSPLVQAYGAREIGSGLAILLSPNPNPMVWTRVAGDLLDLATLAPGLMPGNRRQANAAASFASVLLITALDVFTAMQESDARPRRKAPEIDYSDRSGFPARSEAVPAAVTEEGQGH